MLTEEFVSKVRTALNEMQSISLSEMDSVELMNRFDTKYIFSAERLLEILTLVKNDYRVLEVKGVRLNRYNNLYFDTSDYKFFNEHHNKKANRLKVRYRKYADSGVTFFEVKKKNNKDKTEKYRISCSEIPDNLDEAAKEVLKGLSAGLDVNLLIPIQRNDFYRMTLVNTRTYERATIDIDLSFRNNENKISLANLVVAEVKQDVHSGISPISRKLKEEKIYPTSVSKYILGELLLNDSLKRNNFKTKLHNIKKIEHALSA